MIRSPDNSCSIVGLKHCLTSENFQTVPWVLISLWFSSHSWKWKHFLGAGVHQATIVIYEAILSGEVARFFFFFFLNWTLMKCRALKLTNYWQSSLRLESHNIRKNQVDEQQSNIWCNLLQCNIGISNRLRFESHRILYDQFSKNQCC